MKATDFRATNLRATDLMIGDWVKLSKGNWSKNRQVGLTDIEMIAESVYLAEPIPLTEEILEKNGFKHQTKYDVYRCQDGEIVIEVGIYHPDFVNIGYDYTTPDGRQKGEIASICKVDGADIYVHELQHALKLCGIEKEIVL